MKNDHDFYSDARVRKHVIQKYKILLYSFGKAIEAHFSGDIEKYCRTRQMFATLLREANKGKGASLTDSQAKQLVIYKNKFRKYGALPEKFFQLVVKIDGKPQRIPKKVILDMLRQTGFKFVSHGKHFIKNEHWSNFAMPKFAKTKELYEKYKELEKDMTKEEKEILKKECEVGMHCMSYEDMLKFKEKQERIKAKSQDKRIKRIAKKTLVEEQTKIAKLEQENSRLKAEIEHLKSLKDMNSDIPEDKDFVIEYEDLEKYFKDGKIDPDDPKDKELMKHLSEHCKMRLDYDYEQEKHLREDAPLAEDEAQAQIDACQKLLESRELEDDIPTEEETKATRHKFLSFKLQEFHEKKYLQASEAERIRACSIYADELPSIKDKGTTLADTSKQLKARKTICKYITDHKEEFGLAADVPEDLDSQHQQLLRWIMTTAKCCK